METLQSFVEGSEGLPVRKPMMYRVFLVDQKANVLVKDGKGDIIATLNSTNKEEVLNPGYFRSASKNINLLTHMKKIGFEAIDMDAYNMDKILDADLPEMQFGLLNQKVDVTKEDIIKDPDTYDVDTESMKETLLLNDVIKVDNKEVDVDFRDKEITISRRKPK
jgi:hypothetical protein